MLGFRLENQRHEHNVVILVILSPYLGMRSHVRSVSVPRNVFYYYGLSKLLIKSRDRSGLAAVTHV